MSITQVDPGGVIVRLVQRVDKPAGWTSDGDSQTYRWLGAYYRAREIEGVNGPFGFQGGFYEGKIGEEGGFELTFPNAAGEDGKLHRNRFYVISGTPVGSEIRKYRPGDEFFEIYRQTGRGGPLGDPLFVGTPTKARRTLGEVVISGSDARFLARKWRDTAASFWRHAPRDVFWHYTRAPVSVIADPFNEDSGRFTYSTGSQTTADGEWTYERAEHDTANPGTVRLRPGAGSQLAKLRAATGGFADGNVAAWRVEFSVRRSALDASAYLRCLVTSSTGHGYQVNVTASEVVLAKRTASGGNTLVSRLSPVDTNPPGPFNFIIEKRDGWIYFYLDNRLLTMLSANRESEYSSWGAGSGTPTLYPEIQVFSGSGTGTTDGNAWVDFVHAREWQEALQRGGIQGDLELPGVPPTSGLLGEYFETTALHKEGGVIDPWRYEGAPGFQSRALRVDKPVANASGPAGTGSGSGANPLVPSDALTFQGEYIFARWVGAIWLDLDDFDYALRARDVDDRARVWIGKTRWGEEYINDWTSGHAATTTTGAWLKAGSSAGSAPAGSTGVLASQGTGWYPIVVEFGQGVGGAGLFLEWQKQGAVGTWTALGLYGTADEPKLSVLGIHRANPRFDSHHGQLEEAESTWGLQSALDHRRLESGQFPGLLVPRVRVGVDRNYRLTAENGADVAVESIAEDVIDTLFLDTAGTADSSGGQVVREGMDFSELDPGTHPFVSSEHESLADITVPDLADQRAQSIITLKGEVWEEASVRPVEGRAFVELWQLTDLADFAWAPGDGVLLHLPEVGLVDQSPRQIISVKRTISPEGVGKPEASFRQRPRTQRRLLRDHLRRAAIYQRNYQPQVARVSGSWARANHSDSTLRDTRVALPMNLLEIRHADFVMLTDPSVAGIITVNGVATTITADRAGRYDVSRWVGRYSTHTPLMWASVPTGSGAAEYVLELEVVISRNETP